MNGIDDLMPKPDDRWATATRRAQGVADLGLDRALKTYYTLYFPAGVIILVAAGTILGNLAFGGEPADWGSSLLIGWSLAALGAMIGGLLYNAKRIAPAAELGRIDVLVALEDEERKDIRRQILGKAPVDPDHLAVSQAAAVQLRKNLASQLTWMPVFPLLLIPQAFRGDGIHHVAYGHSRDCPANRGHALLPATSAGPAVSLRGQAGSHPGRNERNPSGPCQLCRVPGPFRGHEAESSYVRTLRDEQGHRGSPQLL